MTPWADAALGPTYRTGCKRGHATVRLRGDDGACLKCGRQDPPAERLAPEQLAALVRRRHADRQRRPEDDLTLDEAVAQTALKLRALAVLTDVDVEDPDAYGRWLRATVAAHSTVDERLAEYHEDEVRWAVRAAYV